MDIISKSQVLQKPKKIIDRIKSGEIFIHPTDTIYGISCIATNEKSIQKIREIKKRRKKPFSIWAPSIKWINENFEIKENWLKKFPGPYTFILPLKSNKLAKNITYTKTIGIRIPNHWMNKIIEKLDAPIITTSVNISGKKHMTSLNDLDKEIEKKVSFCIYEGKKDGNPSTIINLITKETIKR